MWWLIVWTPPRSGGSSKPRLQRSWPKLSFIEFLSLQLPAIIRLAPTIVLQTFRDLEKSICFTKTLSGIRPLKHGKGGYKVAVERSEEVACDEGEEQTEEVR